MPGRCVLLKDQQRAAKLELHHNDVHQIDVLMQLSQPISSPSEAATLGLSGLTLERAYVRSLKLELVSCDADSFVLFNKVTGDLNYFGQRDKPNLVWNSFHCDLAADVLCDAQAHSAQFSANGLRVRCRIGLIEQEGDCYVEAALRALVAYRRLQPEAGPSSTDAMRFQKT